MGIEKLELLRLPRGHENKIVGFNESKKRELEDYVKSIERKYNIKINLKWHDNIRRLLKTISSFPSSGLDFDENRKRFMFHNVYKEKDAIPLHQIALRYINLID